MLLLFLFLAILLCVVVHLAAIAWLARYLGITVREVSIGLGPTLVRGKGFRLGLFPVGGYVRLRSIHEEDVPVDEVRSTLEGASVIKQFAVALFGCLVLLVLACVLAGSHALAAFLNMPTQIVAGAIPPFETAQKLLIETSTFLRDAPATLILGVVAAKFAALNLLPLPALNGGAALGVLGRASGIARVWPQAATNALLFVWLGLLALWLLALVTWLSGA